MSLSLSLTHRTHTTSTDLCDVLVLVDEFDEFRTISMKRPKHERCLARANFGPPTRNGKVLGYVRQNLLLCNRNHRRMLSVRPPRNDKLLGYVRQNFFIA